MSLALDALLITSGWIHVLLAPYTKVEESFNLHATHDIIMYGVGSKNLYNYDHFTFPGAIPRTFVGSLVLAWLTTPVVYAANALGYVSSKFDIQILLRLVLATLTSLTLTLIRHAVSRRFGRLTGLFYTLITITQFHLPFWMSRTIPNTFALIPVNITSYLILHRPPNAKRPLPRTINTALAVLVFSSIVFRAELVLLLIPLTLQSIYMRYTTLFQILKTGFTTALFSITLTTLVDSYFWDKGYPLWPELSSVYFNIYEGKSSDWGVEPWHFYITSSLPKLLLSTLPLSLLGLILDARIRRFLFPSLVFLAGISALPHKEWRFIMYIIPPLNVSSARAARYLVGAPKSKLRGRLSFLGVFTLLLLNLGCTIGFTVASMGNYPGGEALHRFHRLVPAESNAHVHVHISNLAAQTGASQFLHLNSPPYFPGLRVPTSGATSASSASRFWVYNKTENIDTYTLSRSRSFTHLIAEAPCGDFSKRYWENMSDADGFERWVVNWELVRRPWRVWRGKTKTKGKGQKSGKWNRWDVREYVDVDVQSIKDLLGFVRMERGKKLCILRRK